MKLDKFLFPSIAFVADQLGLTLVIGRWGDMIRYAVGREGDEAVGVAPEQMTPYFPSLEQLERFCWNRRDHYRGLATAMSNAQQPNLCVEQRKEKIRRDRPTAAMKRESRKRSSEPEVST